jgi:hypothetical protein
MEALCGGVYYHQIRYWVDNEIDETDGATTFDPRQMVSIFQTLFNTLRHMT